MKHNEKEFEYRGHWLGKRHNSPYWYIFWRRPRSQRVHRRSTRTNEIEIAKEALVAFAGNSGSPRVEEPSWFRIRDALDLYEAHMRGRASHDSVLATRQRLLAFCRACKIEYVSQFTIDHQDRYIEMRRIDIRKGGWAGSNASINRELGVLRTALHHAWKCGRLVHEPYIQHLPDPPPRERVLTLEECHRLMAACEEPHLHLFVKMALFTLQRKSAILQLRVAQVNLATKRIDFHPPGKPASNKRRPVIPIGDGLWPDLAKAVQESRSGYIIEYKGHPVQSVKRALQTASERIGIKKVTPNVLRRTAATLLAGAGVPMRQIAGMLGHSHIQTTERYAKHQPEYLMDAVDCLDNADL